MSDEGERKEDIHDEGQRKEDTRDEGQRTGWMMDSSVHCIPLHQYITARPECGNELDSIIFSDIPSINNTCMLGQHYFIF